MIRVRSWHEAYAADGPQALAAFGWKGGQAKLNAAQQAELTAAMAARIFVSTAAAIAHIAAHYGVSYSKAGVIKLLHRLDFVYRKPKALPGKADVAAQQAFIAAYERLLNGLDDDEVVYFADAGRIPSIRAGPLMAGSSGATSLPCPKPMAGNA